MLFGCGRHRDGLVVVWNLVVQYIGFILGDLKYFSSAAAFEKSGIKVCK